MATLQKGLFKDLKVQQRLFPGIEKGPLTKVNALVIHQTGAPTTQHTFNSYQNGGHGAHFLIDKMGKIYQTANLNKKAYHVGKIKSKCYETKVCTKAQLQAATQILFKKGQKYSTNVTNLHNSEKVKSYPDRYPLNSDSIGIEIVGDYDINAKAYESVGPLQNQSLKWLIGELLTLFSITKADIYRHPKISYKMPSEAGTATW
jgi:N-acetyl-anhydromuramyl-L-alanine amidase AmpD